MTLTSTDIITISLGLVTLVATVAGSYIGYKNHQYVQRKAPEIMILPLYDCQCISGFDLPPIPAAYMRR
ncbi:hypothetical protein GJ744_008582 [Endocarpon pusillum]|uniref:Uncharacterized protein n=1 Tax=Endocarpon pusillum TaxID=364733 RepID=A0A8H7E5F3_9EURO|nr:hypothetical protein GJ744_008582 [Endocarpon pusillum]